MTSDSTIAEQTLSTGCDTTLVNKLGLHARAAASLVNTADRFAAEVVLIRKDNGQRANAKSIMGLMMLGASCGTQFKLEALGSDADSALSTVVDLINNRFGEVE